MTEKVAQRKDGSKSRLQRRIDTARSLANDLADQGHARMAQVIRDLCNSAAATDTLNGRLTASLRAKKVNRLVAGLSDTLRTKLCEIMVLDDMFRLDEGEAHGAYTALVRRRLLEVHKFADMGTLYRFTPLGLAARARLIEQEK